MITKMVWLENLVLLNKCVRESGGKIDITSSFTDADGDVAVRVVFDFITPAKLKEYESHRTTPKSSSEYVGSKISF